MSFSENLINIFNDLGKKMGVVIDWSDKNVMPYLNDLTNRIVDYKMLIVSMLLVIGVIILIVALTNIVIGFKKRKKYYTTDYSSDTYIAHFFCGAIGMLVSGAMIICNLIELFKCLTVRELVIIDFITKYIK